MVGKLEHARFVRISGFWTVFELIEGNWTKVDKKEVDKVDKICGQNGQSGQNLWTKWTKWPFIMKTATVYSLSHYHFELRLE